MLRLGGIRLSTLHTDRSEISMPMPAIDVVASRVHEVISYPYPVSLKVCDAESLDLTYTD